MPPEKMERVSPTLHCGFVSFWKRRSGGQKTHDSVTRNGPDPLPVCRSRGKDLKASSSTAVEKGDCIKSSAVVRGEERNEAHSFQSRCARCKGAKVSKRASASERAKRRNEGAPNRSCRLAIRASSLGQVALSSGSGLEDGASFGAREVLLEVTRRKRSDGEIERGLERVHESLEDVVRGSHKVGDGGHSLDAGTRVRPLPGDGESESVVLCDVDELDRVLVSRIVDVIDSSAVEQR